MDPILKKLYEQPVLGALGDVALEEHVLPHVTLRRYRTGDTVFRQGNPSEMFYMISEGEFETLFEEEEAGDSRRINLLYPDDFFGDIGLLTGAARGVTVRALMDSEVLVMEAAAFNRLLSDFPVVGRYVERLGAEIEERTVETFVGQGQDEIILYKERRHWIALVRRQLPLLWFVVAWFLAMGLAAWIFRANPEAQNYVVLVALMLWLFPVLFFLWQLVDWYNDYYIITNRRVIQIEKIIGWMNERFEAPLNKIQNVTVARATPLGDFLNYGKVVIATAAQGEGQGTILLDYIPNADQIAERIMLELNREKSVLAQQENQERRRALRSALGFDKHPEERPADQVPSPPPAPPPPQAIGLIQRLLHYLRPVMREQHGSTVTWRRHWFMLLLTSLPAYLLLFLIVGGSTFAMLQLTLTPAQSRLTVGVGVLLSLAVIGWIWWLYDDWRNDLYILTADAILDEEKQPLGFNKEVRRAPLDTIQDIRYRQPHPLMVWLGVGNVLIQTAGQQGDFTFDWVQDPREVQLDIFQAIQRRQQQRQRSEAAQINQELLELLKLYEEERRDAERRARDEAPPDPSDPEAPTRRSRSQ